MDDFKKNAVKSTVLGLYGFIIPMIIGTLTGIYILKFSVITSVLLASMFASHTLITYPIISKYGISKNRAVNISVGSTLITNTLSLMVLAIVVGMTQGEINNLFWLKLSVSFIMFSLIIIFLFPVIARWFFKRFSDNVSQYIFVLAIVFLGSVLSKLAGIEAIIGAFMSGLALNRLIPRTSPLMNRIDFVGSAIFIPFFLIGVGMLIDYRAFTNTGTLLVALTMSIVAVIGKYIPAWLTQKNFKFSKVERGLIFGLTNAQAAATLAAVLIGYNIILGYNDEGEPLRLLNDSVLNGTIIMILVTCTIASFVTQKSAQNIALSEQDEELSENREKILIPVNNPNNIEELVNLSTIVKSKNNRDGIYALHIMKSDNSEPDSERRAFRLLDQAKIAAAATDIEMHTLLRYDADLVNGIISITLEHNITDLILGLHRKGGISDTFLGNLTEGILSRSNVTTYIYHPFQPISTIKRHIVIVPENAENEIGFPFWLVKIWNIAQNTGAKIIFYSSESTRKLTNDICVRHPINIEFREFKNWDKFLNLSNEIKSDDNLVIILSRKNYISYQSGMNEIPTFLNTYFKENNFLLVYPIQFYTIGNQKVDLNNPSLLETIEKIDIIGKTIAGIFRK